MPKPGFCRDIISTFFATRFASELCRCELYEPGPTSWSVDVETRSIPPAESLSLELSALPALVRFFSMVLCFGLCAPGPGTNSFCGRGRAGEPDLKLELGRERCFCFSADFANLPKVEAGMYEPGPGVLSPVPIDIASIRSSRFCVPPPKVPSFPPLVFAFALSFSSCEAEGVASQPKDFLRGSV